MVAEIISSDIGELACGRRGMSPGPGDSCRGQRTGRGGAARGREEIAGGMCVFARVRGEENEDRGVSVRRDHFPGSTKMIWGMEGEGRGKNPAPRSSPHHRRDHI